MPGENIYDPTLDIVGQAAGDFSGFSVSLSADGTIVAIGSPMTIYVYPNGPGYAKIYKFNGTSWNQLGQTINGEGLDTSGFSVSLSADGNRVAITSVDTIGSLKIFEFYNGNWVLLGQDIVGTNVGDFLGRSVSLSADGTTVATCIRITPDNFVTRVFKLNGTNYSNYNWGIFGQDITIPYVSARVVGINVSLNEHGTRLAISAIENNVTIVYEYESASDSWVQIGNEIPNDQSGYFNDGTIIFTGIIHSRFLSLNSEGNRFALGFDNTDGFKGSTKIFELQDNNNWEQLGNEIPGENSGDLSGYSVSLSADGTRVAIGAIHNDPNNVQDAGNTRVFQLNDNSWRPLGYPIVGQAANDLSGFSVSLSADGTRVAIGAVCNDANPVNNDDRGNTRVFQWDSERELWTQVLFDPIIASVCFVKGTPVQTDQGVVSIELIDPSVNTINGGEKICLLYTSPSPRD